MELILVLAPLRFSLISIPLRYNLENGDRADEEIANVISIPLRYNLEEPSVEALSAEALLFQFH